MIHKICLVLVAVTSAALAATRAGMPNSSFCEEAAYKAVLQCLCDHGYTVNMLNKTWNLSPCDTPYDFAVCVSILERWCSAGVPPLAPWSGRQATKCATKDLAAARRWVKEEQMCTLMPNFSYSALPPGCLNVPLKNFRTWIQFYSWTYRIVGAILLIAIPSSLILFSTNLANN